LPYARRILSGLLDAQRCVDQLASEPTGTVALGIIPTIAPYVLREVLEKTRTQLPRVKVAVREDLTENLVRALDQGEIDLAIVSTCKGGPGIYRETWATEPFLLAVSAEHRLAKRQSISAKDLQSETLLLLNEGHCLAQQIHRWCDRHGVRASKEQSAFQLSTVLSLVAGGEGVSLVPLIAIPYEHANNCVFVKLRTSILTRELNTIRNPARFWSKATAGVSDVARGIILGRLGELPAADASRN
jgi:LysR family transcriptional regulator, hydrogen peroxide-inducible genes activator